MLQRLKYDVRHNTHDMREFGWVSNKRGVNRTERTVVLLIQNRAIHWTLTVKTDSVQSLVVQLSLQAKCRKCRDDSRRFCLYNTTETELLEKTSAKPCYVWTRRKVKAIMANMFIKLKHKHHNKYNINKVS